MGPAGVLYRKYPAQLIAAFPSATASYAAALPRRVPGPEGRSALYPEVHAFRISWKAPNHPGGLKIAVEGDRHAEMLKRRQGTGDLRLLKRNGLEAHARHEAAIFR